ncbi:MAG: hypothetical protein Q8K79_12670 [Solirubrobacteraceae bacterium]|nr:hypothetical protein [Solirubrobacteraceae bacterium]
MLARRDLRAHVGAGARAALAVVGAAVAGIACGGDPVEAPTPPPAPTRAAIDAPLAGRAPQARRLTITVTENAAGRFRYEAPRSVPAGLVEIRLRNDGAVPHKAQLWRISGNRSVAQAQRTGRPLPDWLNTAGGVALTEPGRTGTTVQTLAPGRYYVAGSGNERGVVAQLRATGTPTTGELPRAAARINAYDFAFRVSGLRPGRQAVEFRNTGAEPHHAYFAPMRAAATVADALRFFSGRGYVGPPPVDVDGTRETVVIEGRERQVTELDLPAGRYALVCFVRNRAGGPQHTELGMFQALTIR